MRISLIVAVSASLVAFPALAGPREDSRELYTALVERGAVFADVFAMKDADAALAAIDQQIVKPVDQATQHWMDIAFAGNSEPYRPYASCVEAGTELHQYAARVSRYLRGIEPRKIEPVYAETFMARLEECEAALGH